MIDALSHLAASQPWAVVLAVGRVAALVNRTDLARHTGPARPWG